MCRGARAGASDLRCPRSPAPPAGLRPGLCLAMRTIIHVPPRYARRPRWRCKLGRPGSAQASPIHMAVFVALELDLAGLGQPALRPLPRPSWRRRLPALSHC